VNSFKTRFIVQFISVSSLIIIIYCLFVGVI
ncbi:TPA: permease, partial [Streptococcus agalactiae]|nr:permease [Streptococcus agalactiae]